jgi:hypothetical protein
MSALFDYFNRSDCRGGSEDENLSARQNDGHPSRGNCQRETVDRPNRIMIVVIIGIGSHQIRCAVFDRHAVDNIEVSVNDGGMIVAARGGRVHVLKRSYKKCQQECQACL